MISEALSDAFARVQGISPDLIRGVQMPEWQDFNELRQIIALIRAGKEEAAKKDRLAQLQTAIEELVRSIPGDPILTELRDAAAGARLRANYKPTEYALKRYYQHLLMELNHELPAKLRISGVHLPLDPRKPRLRIQAKEMILDLERKFEKLFPTTGYSNEAELIAKTTAKDSDLKAVFDILKSEKIELTIRRPEQGRWWVPKVGFQNQFVTGSSRGFFRPGARDSAESGFLGIAETSYSNLDPELKPKYGALRPHRDSGLVPSAEDRSYGEDIYILKLDHIRDRLTLNSGDTNVRLRDAGTGWPYNTHRAETWDQLFVPWKDRAVMGPLMLPKFKEGKLGNPVDPDPSMLKMGWKTNWQYIETQIFGPLDLNDVEAFEFTRSPPVGEFLEELHRKNIKIRDARRLPAVDWTPP